MRASKQPGPTASAGETPTRSRIAGCPVCAGPLIEGRGSSRCTRCQFALCVGCEGGSSEASGAPAPSGSAAAG